MHRRQLVEIEDLPWCPRAVRDGGTDWLAFMANTMKIFNGIAPKIRAAMQATQTTSVIDLCSGGGGPWLTLERELARSGPASVTLSDFYPNADAFADMQARSGGRIDFRREPIDATDVPAAFDGVRTLFNSFHHFSPEMAAAILADAVRKRRAIVIVEPIDHRGLGFAGLPMQLPAILLLTPFVRPFRWRRLLFTYALPLIPLLVLFDGAVSLMRLYLGDEMRELIARVPGHETFDWDVGSSPVGLGIGVPYVIGRPMARPRARPGPSRASLGPSD